MISELAASGTSPRSTNGMTKRLPCSAMHEVAMEQQRRADADGIAMDRGDQRHFIGGKRAQQAPHRECRCRFPARAFR